MKPIRTIIVDDEAPARRTIRKMLERYCKDVFVVGEADDLPSAQVAIQTHRPELVLLDIGLSGASGFNLLERIGEIDFQVVFVTAYANFALDAFRVAATDYLVKPIDVEQLEQAIDRVRARRPPEDNEGTGARITVAVGDTRRFFNARDILRIEADGSYSTIFLASGEEVFVVKKLGLLEDDLPAESFFRTHRTHLVNLNYVTGMKRGEVHLQGGHEVPVSRLKTAELKERLGQMG